MTRHRRTQRAIRLVAVPLVAALVAAACGGGDDDASDTADATAEATGGGDVSNEPADTAAVTAAPPDENTEDGSPVVETLPPEDSAEAVAGGTLRYGLEDDVDGINPTTSALSAPGLLMANAVFDTLAAYTPDGRAVPYLAESFTPNADFTSWDVKIRSGISFHDGTPLNADAVIASFEAQRSSPLVGLAVAPFFPTEGATEKIDDLTVRFNLLDANAYFPATVTGQLGMVASPTWLAAATADETLNQQPVGTGPFKFESRSQDSVTKFVRNDDWWRGEVYLDSVEFYPVRDSATRIDLLFGGELDALQTTDPGSIADLRDDGSIQNVIDDSGEESFAMMNTAVPPFNDINARKALTLATPRQNYIDLIGLGVVRAADGIFIPESPYFNPNVKQLGDDPDGAVALAAEYCAAHGTETNTVLNQPTCTDGKINIELQFAGPDIVQTRIMDILSEGWSVAFNVTRDELPQDEHIQQTALGLYNVNTWRQFGAADPSGDNVWLLCRTAGAISLNWPRLCDESRDQLLLEAQATTDQARRVELYSQLEQMINDAYTYVFFTHTMWDNAFAENVHGVCDRVAPEGEQLACATLGRTYFDGVWMDG